MLTQVAEGVQAKHRILDLSDAQVLEMYWNILLARRLDERMWILHRQHEVAFHISGIGHEATQVGAAFALNRGYDWVHPYYRVKKVLEEYPVA